MKTALTKSAFVRGYDCPARIRHIRDHAPSSSEDNAFVKMLAEGGFQFEHIVRQAFSAGEPWSSTKTDCADLDLITPGLHHEVVFETSGLSARADMIRIGSGALEVFEIKSSSIDGHPEGDPNVLLPADFLDRNGKTQLVKKDGSPRSTYLEKFIDLAFQVHVIEKCLEDLGITTPVLPRLVLINKLGMPDRFDLFPNVQTVFDPGTRSCTPGFVLTPPASWHSSLVSAFDVSAPVARIRSGNGESDARRWTDWGVDRIVEDARSIWQNGEGELANLAREERGWKCRDCEFRVEKNDAESGFRKCWPDDAGTLDELLTLHRGDTYAGSGKASDGRWVDSLATTTPPVRLVDLTIDGTGVYADRQRRQQRSILQDRLVVDDRIGLRAGLVPDHRGDVFWFLDFETIGTALPHYPDVRPYGSFIFQYSLHGLHIDRSNGEVLDFAHLDWLFTDAPEAKTMDEVERAMLAALSRHLELPVGSKSPSPSSPIFHWAPHERTMLNATRTRLTGTSGLDSGPPPAILDSILGVSTTPDSSRLIDMCHLAQKHVAHPSFGGSYSIKKVLPAAVAQDSARKLIEDLVPELAGTARQYRSPYEALAARMDPQHRIADGTAAMEAFNALRRDPPPPGADQIDAALRLYCRLDTAAMAAVWAWLVGYSRA